MKITNQQKSKKGQQGPRSRRRKRDLLEVEGVPRPMSVLFQPQPANESLIAKQSFLELKYLDNYNNTTASSAGTVSDITAVPQGNTDVTRSGDMISLHSVEWTVNFGLAAAGDNTNICRWIVFQWHGDTAVDVPALGSILNFTTYPISAFAHDNVQKFHVLVDEIIDLSLQGPASITRRGVITRFNRACRFLGGGTTGTNHIFFAYLSDSGAIPHPNIIFYTRTNYYDA